MAAAHTRLVARRAGARSRCSSRRGLLLPSCCLLLFAWAAVASGWSLRRDSLEKRNRRSLLDSRTDSNAWWCAVDAPGVRCTLAHGCAPDDACAWPGESGDAVAVMLSDRLGFALNVTLNSVCSFAASPVTLVLISNAPQRGM